MQRYVWNMPKKFAYNEYLLTTSSFLCTPLSVIIYLLQVNLLYTEILKNIYLGENTAKVHIGYIFYLYVYPNSQEDRMQQPGPMIVVSQTNIKRIFIGTKICVIFKARIEQQHVIQNTKI